MNNIYKDKRNSLGLSRDDVCDYISENYLGVITTERLERIENDKFPIRADEVLILSKVYKDPSLCNYYCANECPIGKDYVPEIKISGLEKTILSMIASLNSIEKRQERLIEITADGAIEGDELTDFVKIQNELEKISITVESLQLWTEQMLATGKIDIIEYERLKNQ